MIYFIRAGKDGPVKIGVDMSGSRFASLQTGHYRTLEVLRKIDGSRREESWLHDHFSAVRIRGEWFEFDEKMMTVVPPAFPKDEPSFVAMTVSEMRETASYLWGDREWQTRLAKELGVGARTVRRWVSKNDSIPQIAAVAIRSLAEVKRLMES